MNYVMNPDKTEEMVYVTPRNLEKDADTAMMQLTLTYEQFSHRSIHAPPPAKGAKPIKAFHVIQSFAPGECSPEEAHAIGIEWVRKAFGKRYQAMICTHVDKQHIHNHVLLCPYDLKGKKFNSNLNSIKHIRDVSDEICRAHGIGIMEQLRAQPDHQSCAMTYGEWKHCKMGTSWKERIRTRIDLLAQSVDSFDELLAKLESQGYTIKRGKYISVKAPDQGRAVRLLTLGGAYTEQCLSRQIEEYVGSRPKDKTLKDHIEDLWEEYHNKTGEFSEAEPDAYELSRQLQIINAEHIDSIRILEGKLENVQKEIEKIETEISGGDVPSFRIDKYSERLSELRTKENDYQAIKDSYDLSQKGNYIDRIYNEAQRRFDEQEKEKKRLLKAESYEVYLPNDDNYPPFSEWKEYPTTADYTKIFEGKMNFDENERIGEKLEKIYDAIPRGGVGMIIKLGGVAYYTDEVGFKQLKSFDDPEPEREQEKIENKPLEQEKAAEQKNTPKKKRGR